MASHTKKNIPEGDESQLTSQGGLQKQTKSQQSRKSRQVQELSSSHATRKNQAPNSSHVSRKSQQAPGPSSSPLGKSDASAAQEVNTVQKEYKELLELGNCLECKWKRNYHPCLQDDSAKNEECKAEMRRRGSDYDEPKDTCKVVSKGGYHSGNYYALSKLSHLDEKLEEEPFDPNDSLNRKSMIFAQKTQSRSVQDIHSRSAQDIKSRSAQNIVSKSAQDIESKSGQNIASKSAQDIASKSGQNIKSKSSQNIESKSGQNNKSKSSKNTVSKAGQNIASKFAEDIATKSGQSQTAVSKSGQNNASKSAKDKQSNSKQYIASKSGQVMALNSGKSIVLKSAHDNQSKSAQDYPSKSVEDEDPESKSDQDIPSKSDQDPASKSGEDIQSKSGHDILSKSRSGLDIHSKSAQDIQVSAYGVVHGPDRDYTVKKSQKAMESDVAIHAHIHASKHNNDENEDEDANGAESLTRVNASHSKKDIHQSVSKTTQREGKVRPESVDTKALLYDKQLHPTPTTRQEELARESLVPIPQELHSKATLGVACDKQKQLDSLSQAGECKISDCKWKKNYHPCANMNDEDDSKRCKVWAESQGISVKEAKLGQTFELQRSEGSSIRSVTASLMGNIDQLVGGAIRGARDELTSTKKLVIKRQNEKDEKGLLLCAPNVPFKDMTEDEVRKLVEQLIAKAKEQEEQ